MNIPYDAAKSAATFPAVSPCVRRAIRAIITIVTIPKSDWMIRGINVPGCVIL
jgi:hypothetical protein